MPARWMRLMATPIRVRRIRQGRQSKLRCWYLLSDSERDSVSSTTSSTLLAKQFTAIPKSNKIPCRGHYKRLQGDIVQSLYPMLMNSETTASYFSQGDTSELEASSIMIYDTGANRFVGNSGYVSVDLPPRGSVAHWDSYLARY